MEFKIPKPLKEEHEELHAELVKATQVKGKIGEAAQAVAKVLHPHFVKEEEYALPPLGLLPHLAAGKITPEMAGVFRMTDTLKSVLPQLLKEHKAIVAELESLADAAKKEKRPEFARFAEKMILHAKTEEEVLYPATILIGEYLKQKLNPSSKLW
jgi:hemerythrin superfamily protein